MPGICPSGSGAGVDPGPPRWLDEKHDRIEVVGLAPASLTPWHDLGIDARRALSDAQIQVIGGWRHRSEPLGIATARAEARRLAKRIEDLDGELATNRAQLAEIVTDRAPHLLALPGVGVVTAAVILSVWSHPGRIRSEAALAQIAGTCPIPASSGNTVRHRLNRGGNRHLNWAMSTIVLTRMRTDPTTRAYIDRRTAEGKSSREIRRALKRYATRQIYRTLTASPPATSPGAA